MDYIEAHIDPNVSVSGMFYNGCVETWKGK